MSDDLLDTEIEPAHQALAARLALASVDHDGPRTAAGLSEVIEGGMGVAQAVTALMSKHTGLLLTATPRRSRRPVGCCRRPSWMRVRPSTGEARFGHAGVTVRYT
jgi:hypothetical protein